MVVKKHIEYPGIEAPRSIAELKVEIAGLKNAVKIAEELISRHEQVLSIIALKMEEEKYALQKASTTQNKNGQREAKTEEKE